MSSKQTKKPTEPEVQPEQNNTLALQYKAQALSLFTQTQFEILTEKVPPHALKKREDGYEYVASGWIKKKLFDAFGMDWNEEMLPIDGDKLYALKEDQQNNKPVRYIAVMLRVRANIRNPKTLEVITTLEKVGVGSQVWRNKMELGDAIKGAKTDALRNAAFDMGIGFNYKWDDEAELQKFDEKQKAKNGFAPPAESEPPTTLVGLITRSGLGIDELCAKLRITSVSEIKDFSDAWTKLSAT